MVTTYSRSNINEVSWYRESANLFSLTKIGTEH
jgi:hypothetical protein